MNFRPRHISSEDLEVMRARVKGGLRGKSSCQPGQARASVSSLDTTTVRQAAPSPYRSKWEAAYAAKLELEKKAGLIKDWRYEPMSFTLAKGKRYRPDFLVEQRLPLDDLDRRTLELVEVKGWHKNKRDAMTRLKWAAQLYPMFIWRIVHRQGNGWTGQYV